MSAQDTTLHLVCGKIAAGKSTLTARLGQEPDTLVVAEDDWLARLYPGEQTCRADYAGNAARLRDAMGPHIVALLRIDCTSSMCPSTSASCGCTGGTPMARMPSR